MAVADHKTQDADATDAGAEMSIKLPENEFAFLQEILKNPIGDNRFEISKEAPKAAFKGRGSPKTLAQTAKNKLIERGIIESIQRGGAQSRAIVRVLNDNVEMSNEGRGRKVTTGRRASSEPKKPDGRRKASATNRTERTPVRGKREEPATPGPGRRGKYSLGGVFSKMRDNYENLDAFQNELQGLEKRYPNSFTNFLKTLRGAA